MMCGVCGKIALQLVVMEEGEEPEIVLTTVTKYQVSRKIL